MAVRVLPIADVPDIVTFPSSTVSSGRRNTNSDALAQPLLATVNSNLSFSKSVACGSVIST